MRYVTVLGGGTFRKCLGHEGGAFMSGIGALPPSEDTAKVQLSMSQKAGTQKILNLPAPASQTS